MLDSSPTTVQYVENAEGSGHPGGMDCRKCGVNKWAVENWV